MLCACVFVFYCDTAKKRANATSSAGKLVPNNSTKMSAATPAKSLPFPTSTLPSTTNAKPLSM